MTLEERLKLIRERVRKQGALSPKPAGLFVAANPEAEPATKPIRARRNAVGSQWVANPFGLIRDFTVRNGVTLEMPPKAEETFKEAIRREPHPLTKIAGQLPAKLPQLTFCPRTRKRIRIS